MQGLGFRFEGKSSCPQREPELVTVFNTTVHEIAKSFIVHPRKKKKKKRKINGQKCLNSDMPSSGCCTQS